MNDVLAILLLLILLQAFVPLLQKRLLLTRRQMALRAIEVERKSRVITIIRTSYQQRSVGPPRPLVPPLLHREAVGGEGETRGAAGGEAACRKIHQLPFPIPLAFRRRGRGGGQGMG